MEKKHPVRAQFSLFRALDLNMKNIPSVLHVFVMLVKHQEQSIKFIVVSPISRTQMDLSECSCFPSHS